MNAVNAQTKYLAAAQAVNAAATVWFHSTRENHQATKDAYFAALKQLDTVSPAYFAAIARR